MSFQRLNKLKADFLNDLNTFAIDEDLREKFTHACTTSINEDELNRVTEHLTAFLAGE